MAFTMPFACHHRSPYRAAGCQRRRRRFDGVSEPRPAFEAFTPFATGFGFATMTLLAGQDGARSSRRGRRLFLFWPPPLAATSSPVKRRRLSRVSTSRQTSSSPARAADEQARSHDIFSLRRLVIYNTADAIVPRDFANAACLCAFRAEGAFQQVVGFGRGIPLFSISRRATRHDALGRHQAAADVARRHTGRKQAVERMPMHEARFCWCAARRAASAAIGENGFQHFAAARQMRE